MERSKPFVLAISTLKQLFSLLKTETLSAEFHHAQQYRNITGIKITIYLILVRNQSGHVGLIVVGCFHRD